MAECGARRGPGGGVWREHMSGGQPPGGLGMGGWLGLREAWVSCSGLRVSYVILSHDVWHGMLSYAWMSC